MLSLVLTAAAAASLAALFYHYIGYALLLRVLTLGARPRPPAPPAPLPALSVIIPCYNEAAVLAAKLADLRAAEYPGENVEVIVVSDGSDDDTAAVAARSPGVRLISWSRRRGKPAALNAAARAASGEVLVFTDANARLAAATLSELVAPFADGDVGAVCGEQVISAGGAGERWYWRYESYIKRLEAALASPVGADGSLYAVRRELYRPVPEGRLIMDDLYVSLAVVAAGRRLAYAPAAVVFEEALADAGREFRRKARIMVGSITALAALDGRIWRRLGWQLFSHKILRWLGPLFLAAALAAAAAGAALGGVVAAGLLAAQLLFYAAAAGGALGVGGRRRGLWRGPFYFVSANAALAYGWFLFLFGKSEPAWEKLR